MSCAVSLLGVWCVGECLSVLFTQWDTLTSTPLVVVEGGAIVDGGVALCSGVAS